MVRHFLHPPGGSTVDVGAKIRVQRAVMKEIQRQQVQSCLPDNTARLAPPLLRKHCYVFHFFFIFFFKSTSLLAPYFTEKLKRSLFRKMRGNVITSKNVIIPLSPRKRKKEMQMLKGFQFTHLTKQKLKIFQLNLKP